MRLHGGGYSVVLDAPSCMNGCEFGSATAYWSGNEERFSSNFDVTLMREQESLALRLALSEKASEKERNLLLSFLAQDSTWKPFCRIAKPALENQWPNVDWSRIGNLITRPIGGVKKPDLDQLPAAYTYFGQFIAHELSDLALINRDQKLSLTATSAKFDLNSLFDVKQPANPHRSIWCGGVGVGEVNTSDGSTLYGDLPRDREGQAQIGDVRNDHNLGVAQIHVALSQFYQCIARRKWEWEGTDPKLETLSRVQEAALFDYLWKICDPTTYREILCNGRSLIRPGVFDPNTPFLIPIEFAAACFRMGHSMPREEYAPWGRYGVQARFDRLIGFTKLGGLLTEPGKKLPDNWAVGWNHLLGTEQGPKDGVQAAKAIDQFLAEDLGSLDKKFFEKEAHGYGNNPKLNLATVTLFRGIQYQLPSAQTLSRTQPSGAGDMILPFLSGGELIQGLRTQSGVQELIHELKSSNLEEETPIWLYSLLEAQCFHAGQRLGPFATRIVAETIHASIEASGSGLIIDGIIPDLDIKKCRPDRPVYSLHDIVNRANLWTPSK